MKVVQVKTVGVTSHEDGEMRLGFKFDFCASKSVKYRDISYRNIVEFKNQYTYLGLPRVSVVRSCFGMPCDVMRSDISRV